MNKKLLLAVGATITATGFYSTVLTAATITGHASAEVVQALIITEDNGGMNFGDVSESGGGVITLNLDGSVTAGAGTDVIAGGGNVQGIYTITGAEGLSYTLADPGSTTVTTAGGDTMTVDNFVDDADGTASSAGEAFNLGADLHIIGGQNAGSYTGTYPVTVNYD